jgi:serine phosphatase RsbU (regulator of sigma subunit)
MTTALLNTPMPKPDAQAVDLVTLISHTHCVADDEPLEQIYKSFQINGCDFMAVLVGERLLGMCSRREIGMLLGARYGFSLYARKPIREHLTEEALCVVAGTPITKVLATVFARRNETFYDDVILTSADGRFLGLIATHTLVRLENEMLRNNIDRLKEQRREIESKNMQIESDLRMARELQIALLASQSTLFPVSEATAGKPTATFGFHYRYEPSGQVGGDLFHIVQLSDTAVGVFLCDVMGHGVRSALMTAMLRALIEEAARGARGLAANPAALIMEVNSEFSRILRQAGAVMFATAVYMVIDAAEKTVRFASAGHPDPVLLRRDLGMLDRLTVPREAASPALGLFPNATCATVERPISPGDALLLYTDGLYEVDNAAGEEFGEEALCKAFSRRLKQPANVLVDTVLEEVREYSKEGRFSDDVCVICVEIPGES